MDITATMVKELRDKTGAGMMDAKKALVEVDGDMEKAMEVLRQKGIASADKKMGRIAAEGDGTINIIFTILIVLPLGTGTQYIDGTDGILIVTHAHLRLCFYQISLTCTGHDYITVSIAFLCSTRAIGCLVDTTEHI